MASFIFEGRDKTQRTAHEKIAMRNIRHAINWIVGGYYNSFQDGFMEDLPKSRKALENEVYSSAMNHLYMEGCEGFGKAPKEMRFAGERFCRAYIHWKLEGDEEVAEIGEVAGW